jgi:hypothetical protein
MNAGRVGTRVAGTAGAAHDCGTVEYGAVPRPRPLPLPPLELPPLSPGGALPLPDPPLDAIDRPSMFVDGRSVLVSDMNLWTR